ncbi:hypothetical protein THASP1DRAFT_29741 [Thamnocephalis sphaerospora]|uniref:PH domain-containing protein n=1 Tax=Thamnocephalis sphaerospora TaxID=78915 RepID=A0A4P9XSS8_9FUNG|nr:hypothetical protein THASP1DRAFT_29741 [Thamnocephalis sphaerospora]|eukprot:RKP08460.1 hypothetical protein THASP1DRAFT_29741 [Thamnocephalis sphaerospora]
MVSSPATAADTESRLEPGLLSSQAASTSSSRRGSNVDPNTPYTAASTASARQDEMMAEPAHIMPSASFASFGSNLSRTTDVSEFTILTPGAAASLASLASYPPTVTSSSGRAASLFTNRLRQAEAVAGLATDESGQRESSRAARSSNTAGKSSDEAPIVTVPVHAPVYAGHLKTLVSDPLRGGQARWHRREFRFDGRLLCCLEPQRCRAPPGSSMDHPQRHERPHWPTSPHPTPSLSSPLLATARRTTHYLAGEREPVKFFQRIMWSLPVADIEGVEVIRPVANKGVVDTALDAISYARRKRNRARERCLVLRISGGNVRVLRAESARDLQRWSYVLTQAWAMYMWVGRARDTVNELSMANTISSSVNASVLRLPLHHSDPGPRQDTTLRRETSLPSEGTLQGVGHKSSDDKLLPTPEELSSVGAGAGNMARSPAASLDVPVAQVPSDGSATTRAEGQSASASPQPAVPTPQTAESTLSPPLSGGSKSGTMGSMTREDVMEHVRRSLISMSDDEDSENYQRVRNMLRTRGVESGGAPLDATVTNGGAHDRRDNGDLSQSIAAHTPLVASQFGDGQYPDTDEDAPLADSMRKLNEYSQTRQHVRRTSQRNRPPATEVSAIELPAAMMVHALDTADEDEAARLRRQQTTAGASGSAAATAVGGESSTRRTSRRSRPGSIRARRGPSYMRRERRARRVEVVVVDDAHSTPSGDAAEADPSCRTSEDSARTEGPDDVTSTVSGGSVAFARVGRMRSSKGVVVQVSSSSLSADRDQCLQHETAGLKQPVQVMSAARDSTAGADVDATAATTSSSGARKTITECVPSQNSKPLPVPPAALQTSHATQNGTRRISPQPALALSKTPSPSGRHSRDRESRHTSDGGTRRDTATIKRKNAILSDHARIHAVDVDVLAPVPRPAADAANLQRAAEALQQVPTGADTSRSAESRGRERDAREREHLEALQNRRSRGARDVGTIDTSENSRRSAEARRRERRDSEEAYRRTRSYIEGDEAEEDWEDEEESWYNRRPYRQAYGPRSADADMSSDPYARAAAYPPPHPSFYPPHPPPMGYRGPLPCPMPLPPPPPPPHYAPPPSSMHRYRYPPPSTHSSGHHYSYHGSSHYPPPPHMSSMGSSAATMHGRAPSASNNGDLGPQSRPTSGVYDYPPVSVQQLQRSSRNYEKGDVSGKDQRTETRGDRSSKRSEAPMKLRRKEGRS